MKRRSFIKKSSVSGMALTMIPALAFPKEKEFEYSVMELMGKEDIELYGEGINLRLEAHDAFLKMKKAAYSEGIDLKVISSYRSFERQEIIWERKYMRYIRMEH